MRNYLCLTVFLAGCSGEANHLGNPLLLPVNALTSAAENAIYSQRRGQVELIVKSGFNTIIPDIRAGGGATLSDAMDAALIPEGDRPARITQMQGDIGIYDGNPEALITALMVYGN
ncbi:hypothetical protein [Yoonia sp. 208BN28-4]|uniref:hypothetical protein n=1 Tax=Yoonia sp. 208BN28-4 TaxID=3126505 RepID=UPI003097853F